MNIILDSNIFFSALIKDSITRKIILKQYQNFLFPLFIFEEFSKYKNELIKKSKINEKDFNILIRIILTKITIIDSTISKPFQKQAYNIVKNIDINDIEFIACALAIKNSIFWTNDKKLKKIKEIKVLNTKEIILLFNI